MCIGMNGGWKRPGSCRYLRWCPSWVGSLFWPFRGGGFPSSPCGTLLNLPANAVFLFRNLPAFLKIYITWLLFSLAIVVATTALAITGIGLLLVPVVSLWLYFSCSAYELSEIARKCQQALPGDATPPMETPR